MHDFIPQSFTIVNGMTTMVTNNKTYAVLLDRDEKENETDSVIGLVKYTSPYTREILAEYNLSENYVNLFIKKGSDVSLKEEWDSFYSWLRSTRRNVIFFDEVIEYFEIDNEDEFLYDEDGEY